VNQDSTGSLIVTSNLSGTCLLAEGYIALLWYWANNSDYAWPFRHNSVANVLFADGHVKYHTYLEVPDQARNSSAYGSIFYYPFSQY
jgi:prepilin-type processing-associated H-X9-DG protein